MNHILIYLGAALTCAWGVAHLFATHGVVAGFGSITADNRRIITMEWIVEGVALISLAAFVTVVTVHKAATMLPDRVYGVAIATLLVLAVVSIFTGFRIAFLPFRLCPVVFSTSAALIAAGAWL
jgi:hypothetical protein